DSCGQLELPRRDAEGSLEVPGELTLVREADVRGDLRQGEVGPPSQELPGPLDAARDDELVRRQPGGRLELPREVIGAQTGDRGHLLQAPRGPRPRRGAALAAAFRPARAPPSGASGRAGSGGRPGGWPATPRPTAPRRRRRSARPPPPPSRPAGAAGPSCRAAGASAAPG